MTAADQRATYAREFLAGARRRKVAELPPSILVRELAECRRQLGQLLDVLNEQAATLNVARDALLDEPTATVALSSEQREILAQALADAVQYRDPGGLCAGCETSPAGLCDDHADELDKTDAYLALADALGIEVER